MVANLPNTLEDGHYAVVIGIDADYVYLMDPARFTPDEVQPEYGGRSLGGQKVAVPREEFVRRWLDTDAEGKRYLQYGISVRQPATLSEAAGTCKVGQTAKATDCVPASGDSGGGDAPVKGSKASKGEGKVSSDSSEFHPSKIPSHIKDTDEVELLDKSTREVLMRDSAKNVRQAVKDTITDGQTVDDMVARVSTPETKKAEQELRVQAQQRHDDRAKQIQAEAAKDANRPGGKNWQDPPERLYHATFAADPITNDGFKTADELGGDSDVLGGSIRNSVSFTTKENAAKYLDGLNVAWQAARGKLDTNDIKAVTQIGERFGVDAGAMRGILQQHASEQNPQRRMFKVLQAVSLQGKQFPLFMGGDWPKTVIQSQQPPKMISVDSKGLTDNMSYHKGEQEWRVYSPRKINMKSARVE